MIVILTRTTGVKVAVNVTQILSITPNAVNSQCTIDFTAGPTITVIGSIEDTVRKSIEAIRVATRPW